MIRCIVIDDDKNTTVVLSEILELMGLNVVGRGFGGMDAIHLYKKYCPNIAFIDILMPDYDGFYAIKEITKFDPHAKIIVVTADHTMETQQKLDKFNIASLIFKPYHHSQIKQVLEELKISTTRQFTSP